MNIQKLTSIAQVAKTRSIFSLFSESHLFQSDHSQSDLSQSDHSQSDHSQSNSQKDRATDFSLSAAHLYLDYSKQNINSAEFYQLIEIAEQANLSAEIAQQFSGVKINNTEGRAVLHTALRAPKLVKQQVLGETLANEVEAAEQQMMRIVNDVQQGLLTSFTGQRFTDVLALGIGGSYYGVKVGLSALAPYHNTGLAVHVVANVDGGALEEKLIKLDVNTTLVVVISKTFTTQETMLNANAVKQWMLSSVATKSTSSHSQSASAISSTISSSISSTNTKNADSINFDSIIEKQWFAVSTNVDAVINFGINAAHILPMWDWVGGRFSLWSAVGLPLALAIGNDNFAKLKAGAYEMDQHFTSADFSNNMPVIMALLGIWNRNALEYPSLAILPYAHSLRALPGYLQQTDMESNGKSVSRQGDKLPWLTAPVVFGQEGTNGQHAFMQLMHQSDDIIPTDFIVALKGRSQYTENHKVLVANCFAQSEALMQGKTLAQVNTELVSSGLSAEEVSRLAPHKTMKGNTPSNTLVMESLTPEAIGALFALYEHKIFVQGVIWQVNSFDQWGVELGKQLGASVLAAIDGVEGFEKETLSASSKGLIALFKASMK